jgi:hypothetical protein
MRFAPLQPVHAREIEADTALIRDTLQQAEKVAAILGALAANEREIDQVSANTGPNGVVPAWRLMELVDMPWFKDVCAAIGVTGVGGANPTGVITCPVE